MREPQYTHLPTIAQIIAKADTLNGRPMNDEECDEWFRETCRENEQRSHGEKEETR